MKALTRTIMELAVLAGLAGCAKENADSPEKNPAGNTLVTLTANQENTDSRAEISSENRTVINWTKDDAITVIDGAGNNVEFSLTEGEGMSSGKFKGEVSQTADNYTALYPYQEAVSYSDGSLKGVALKSEQTSVAGSFDPEAALMIAVTETGSTDLGFKNIVGFVKVTPTVACARITLVSNNSESKLAGTADITMANGLPKATVTANASSSVSIVGNIEANKTYYIAIFPATMTSGFRLVFTTPDGQDTYKSTDKQLEIKRNLVTNLGNVEGTADEYPYVTFTAASEQTFKMKLASGITNLEYSVGGSNWQSVESSNGISFGGNTGSLRLRGVNKYGTNDEYENSSTISFQDKDIKVSCKGDIRTLVDWKNYKNTNTESALFSNLFKGCSVLVSAPELPATKLAEHCYYYMFYGCTSLIEAPDLPAKVVPSNAYNRMFAYCTSLTQMPVISATTVNSIGMAYMFLECASLNKVTDLKIENFIDSDNCSGMFCDCTSLETAPKLPAMKVTWNCYYSMFKGCTNLREAPALPATELGSNCYQEMFCNCESLELGPEVLPALTASMQCYQQMFQGCKSLIKAPAIKAETMSKSSCQNMFLDCISLWEAPELTATTLAESCYYGMFQGCTSLTYWLNLPATKMAVNCYARMFVNCTRIEEIVLPATTLAGHCYLEMFKGCSSLRLIKLNVKDFDNNDFDNGYLAPFEGWLVGVAETGTVYVRHELAKTTLDAIYLPNEWTFEYFLIED